MEPLKELFRVKVELGIDDPPHGKRYELIVARRGETHHFYALETDDFGNKYAQEVGEDADDRSEIVRQMIDVVAERFFNNAAELFTQQAELGELSQAKKDLEAELVRVKAHLEDATADAAAQAALVVQALKDRDAVAAMAARGTQSLVDVNVARDERDRAAKAAAAASNEASRLADIIERARGILANPVRHETATDAVVDALEILVEADGEASESSEKVGPV